MSVKVLPPEIAGKIAAGEVIERPASVVKELVENSLDAGASSVEVVLKGAGKTQMRVTDDGSGISREDIEQVFARHATSKISRVEDLYGIRSLGFRGEALYSISSVADVLLKAKAAGQDSGWETHVRGGERLGLKPCTMRQGTHIEVTELFFNTPARRKFLKSNAAELGAIIDALIPYCLLFPEKRFRLESDGKVSIDAKPCADSGERISGLLNLAQGDLIQGQKSTGDFSLRLILGDINIQRARKDLQFVFINSRPVECRSISFHLNEIYRLLFPPRVYPFFCVFADMPPSALDVNIHPAKREVRIQEELALIGFLRAFAEHLLMSKSKAKQPRLTEMPDISGTAAGGVAYRQEEFFADATKEKKEGLRTRLAEARYLGNLLRKYLLFESGDSLLVIDQHAAQERITFERLARQLEKGAVELQPLLSPVVLALSPQELASWNENKELLGRTGFETTLFDKTSVAVHAYPATVNDIEQSVRNLLAGGRLSRLAPEEIARMACRSSVMFGFPMNPEQAEFQRSNLLACRDPFTCPHGRPTAIEITDACLRAQFLRT